MRNRMLSGLVVFFALVFGLILFVSDRSISRMIQEWGSLIAQALGF